MQKQFGALLAFCFRDRHGLQAVVIRDAFIFRGLDTAGISA